MKTGQSLVEIAKELERQNGTKKDFIAPTKQLELKAEPVDGTNGTQVALKLRVNGKGVFPVTDIAHGQIAGRLGVPQKYYDRMRSAAPDLLVKNVNHWLQAEPEARMVRTLDGEARAFLSKRYRPLDNADMAEAVLPILQEMGCRLESSALTPSKLYIKAVTERTQFEIRKGDVVQAGIVISNSEVGMGSVKVEPLIYRLVCSNGMISQDHGLNKYHVGRSGEMGDLAAEFLRDDTRQADDKAFWMKVQDIVRGSLNSDVFAKIVAKLKDAAATPIEAEVEEVIERAQERFLLKDKERGGVLRHLLTGGDLTQYGLVQAITRTSQDVEDYERATELERLGGQVLEMPRQSWKELAGR